MYRRMNNFKQTISLILIIMMVICMYGCTGSKTDNSEDKSVPETGAWIINDQINATLPDYVEKAFNKATEGFAGSSLEPIAYVGSQVVSGMNYMILCRVTTATPEPVTTYRMVVIYADLDGNAEITSLKDFDISKYTEGNGLSEQENTSRRMACSGRDKRI